MDGQVRTFVFVLVHCYAGVVRIFEQRSGHVHPRSVDFQADGWFAAAKVVFPVLAWLIFAGVLLARVAWGFRGRKAAYLTIAGFLLGLLTVLGISL